MGALPRHQAIVDRLPRLQLGEMLVARGLLTPKQLSEALEHQKSQGHRKLLGETLVELQFATDEQVMDAVAESYGIPFARDIARIADPKALETLPRDWLLEHLVLPLFLVRETLTVAVAEPANLYLFEEIRRRTGKHVRSWQRPLRVFARHSRHMFPRRMSSSSMTSWADSMNTRSPLLSAKSLRSKICAISRDIRPLSRL